MRKAVAVHTVVLIAMIGIFAMFAIFVFYKWTDVINVQASSWTCAFKRLTYCNDWKANEYGTEPWSWDTKKPLGCENLDSPINKPVRADCDKLI
jgi:hypothetical protein